MRCSTIYALIVTFGITLVHSSPLPVQGLVLPRTPEAPSFNILVARQITPAVSGSPGGSTTSSGSDNDNGDGNGENDGNNDGNDENDGNDDDGKENTDGCGQRGGRSCN